MTSNMDKALKQGFCWVAKDGKAAKMDLHGLCIKYDAFVGELYIVDRDSAEFIYEGNFRHRSHEAGRRWALDRETLVKNYK